MKVNITNTREDEYIAEKALEAISAGELTGEDINILIAERKIFNSLREQCGSLHNINEKNFIEIANNIDRLILEKTKDGVLSAEGIMSIEIMNENILKELFQRKLISE